MDVEDSCFAISNLNISYTQNYGSDAQFSGNRDAPQGLTTFAFDAFPLPAANDGLFNVLILNVTAAGPDGLSFSPEVVITNGPDED